MWLGTYKNGVSYYHPGMFKFEKSPLFINIPNWRTKTVTAFTKIRKTFGLAPTAAVYWSDELVNNDF